MFLITITYKQPLDVVDQYLQEHRAFLEEGYKQDYFIVSGPKNPRVGGVILSQLKDYDQLMTIIKQDPFYLHQVAEYEVVEFTPVKYHRHFEPFIA
jgi:uncharacterized protein YciI